MSQHNHIHIKTKEKITVRRARNSKGAIRMDIKSKNTSIQPQYAVGVKGGTAKRFYSRKMELNIQEDSKDDNSFKAEENENELFGGNVILYSHKPNSNEKDEKNVCNHFEVEMNQHGLLDKIASIQHLNSYLEVEIGGSKRSGSAEGRSYQENNPITAKSFLFPFHKRARSNSPPKNPQLFNSKHKQVTAQQPVIGNFLLAKKVTQNKQIKNGLPTEATNDKVRFKKCGLEDDNWMYQRLDIQQKDTHSFSKDFLRLMNEIEIDSDLDSV